MVGKNPRPDLASAFLASGAALQACLTGGIGERSLVRMTRTVRSRSPPYPEALAAVGAELAPNRRPRPKGFVTSSGKRGNPARLLHRSIHRAWALDDYLPLSERLIRVTILFQDGSSRAG